MFWRKKSYITCSLCDLEIEKSIKGIEEHYRIYCPQKDLASRLDRYTLYYKDKYVIHKVK